MGTARKIRKKWTGPRQPYSLPRFEEELNKVGEYGLRSKKELWKAQTTLTRFRSRARSLLGLEENDERRSREEKLLVDKLVKLSVLSPEKAGLDMILNLTVKEFLDRRLQTQVFRRGLAATPHQARQLVTHGHIAIDNRRVTIPSYHLRQNEEELVDYAPSSPYRDDEHPLRKELLMHLEKKANQPEPEAEESHQRRGDRRSRRR